MGAAAGAFASLGMCRCTEAHLSHTTRHKPDYRALRVERGQIDYSSEAMWVADTDHHILTVYYVEPGSPSASNHARLCAYVDGLRQGMQPTGIGRI
jgi:hypothetical protein